MDSLEKSIVLERAKVSLGIIGIEKEIQTLVDDMKEKEKNGGKPIKEAFKFLRLVAKRDRLYKRLPETLKHMGYDYNEIIAH